MRKIKSLAEKGLLGFAVLAQESVTVGPGSGQFAGLADDKITIPNMVPVIIQVILIIAALVALVFLIIGGIKWITSGGDKTAVESARNTITSALLGLLVVFAAWAILRLIQHFFGIDIFGDMTIPQIGSSGSGPGLPPPIPTGGGPG